MISVWASAQRGKIKIYRKIAVAFELVARNRICSITGLENNPKSKFVQSLFLYFRMWCISPLQYLENGGKYIGIKQTKKHNPAKHPSPSQMLTLGLLLLLIFYIWWETLWSILVYEIGIIPYVHRVTSVGRSSHNISMKRTHSRVCKNFLWHRF